MFRACAIVAALVAVVQPAHAALDAAAAVMQFESNGRNIQQQIVPLSVSTASGYYGITNTTWNTAVVPATGLPKVGPGTANPDGVMDLSAAQQYQGFAQLYNTQGLQPWTCSGCDAPFAVYVAQNGGVNNFSLQGDPNSSGTDSGSVTVSDPGPNAAQNVAANEGGVSADGITITVAGDGTGATGGAGTSATAGTGPPGGGTSLTGGTNATSPITSSTPPETSVLSPAAPANTPATGTGALTVTPGSAQITHLFANAYSFVQTVISQITQAQNSVLSAVRPAITIVATLAIAIMGVLMMLGIIGHSDVMLRWLRIILVVGLLANTANYNTYVTELVLVDVPQWFAGIFNAGGVTSPADSFDNALGTYWAACHNIHPSGLANSIFIPLVETIGLLIVFGILAVMFVAFVVVQVLSALVLLVAPLLILGLMFDFTRRYVHGLVNALVDLAISALFINILVALITGVVVQLIGAVQVAKDPWDTMINLFSGVGTLVVLGLLVPISSRIVKGIAGAVGTPHVPNPVAPAIVVAAAPAAAAGAGPAAAGALIRRAAVPVGRSLSGKW